MCSTNVEMFLLNTRIRQEPCGVCSTNVEMFLASLSEILRLESLLHACGVVSVDRGYQLNICRIIPYAIK